MLFCYTIFSMICEVFMKSFFKSFILSTLGAVSFALAVAFFYDPNKVAAGGITGFAVIISHMFPIVSTGTLTFIFNIPLLILALLRFGKKFVSITVYTTALTSLLMNLFEPIALAHPVADGDLLIAAVCGALLDAAGLGLVYLAGGCTGGTDIIIKFLRQKYRHIKTGGMSLAINMVVIAATLAAFRDIKVAVYSGIAMTLSSVILDKILYGGDGAKLFFIISDKYETITSEILTKLEIGVTLLDGEGAYKHTEKKVMLCAAKKHVFTKIRDIVKEADPDAFIIVSSATEIFGEGYKSQFTDEM